MTMKKIALIVCALVASLTTQAQSELYKKMSQVSGIESFYYTQELMRDPNWKNINNPEEKSKYWQDKYSRFGFTGADDPNFELLHFIPETYKFYIGEKLYTGEIK